MLSHLFLWFAVSVARLRETIFPNLEFGWASKFSGAWKSIQGILSVAILESLHWGEIASLCYNWNLEFLSANTSSLERLVPIFTDHVLGTTCQSNKYFFLLPLAQHLSRRNLWEANQGLGLWWGHVANSKPWKRRKSTNPSIFALPSFFVFPVWCCGLGCNMYNKLSSGQNHNSYSTLLVER